jgi:large subunit ribosomal protein L32
MGALPKRKIAKSRKGKRRSHQGMAAPILIDCPQCHTPKRPHHACPTCGNYDGREAVEIKAAKPKTS